MKQLTINPSNRQYYSEDFIKGFECGTQRQLEADKADIPTWIPCSEKLPEEKKGVYLICTEDGYICSCRWTNVNPIWTDLTVEWHWCEFDIPQYNEAVAWMDLKPWKGVDTNIDCFDSCEYAYSETCDECYKGNKYKRR